jgi:hypothetical protein
MCQHHRTRETAALNGGSVSVYDVVRGFVIVPSRIRHMAIEGGIDIMAERDSGSVELANRVPHQVEARPGREKIGGAS